MECRAAPSTCRVQTETRVPPKLLAVARCRRNSHNATKININQRGNNNSNNRNSWKTNENAAHLENTQQGILCLFIHRFLIHCPTYKLSSTDCKWKCISIKAGNEIDFLSPTPAATRRVCIVTNCVSFFSLSPSPSTPCS